MRKRIFKAGDYGHKGNYTTQDLKKWIGKEFSVLIGHVGDYLKQGIPTSAIPKAGVATCVEIDSEGYVVGDVVYNNFGKEVTSKGAYDNYSIGIDVKGDPDHLALLGYELPHISNLDKAFSLDKSNEDYKYIEFNQGGEKMTLEELLEALNLLPAEERIKVILSVLGSIDITQIDIQPLFNKMWELDDQKWYINKLTGEGYIVEKSSEFSKDKISGYAENLGFILAPKPEPKHLTEDEWKEKYAKEFSMNNEKQLYASKFIGLFPPVFKSLAEFCVDQAYKKENYENIFEFSAEDKKPFSQFIKETVENGGPFDELFKSISAEFKSDPEEKVDSFEAGERLAKM